MFGDSVVGASVLGFDDFDSVPFLFFVGLVSLIVLLLAAFFTRRWFFARRRIITRNITAEYEAPLEFNPAEMSYLFHRSLSERDFAALIVFMAQRGVVHFRKHEGRKIILPGPRYDGKLKEYEKIILDVVEENRMLFVSDLLDGYGSIFKRDGGAGNFTLAVRRDLESRGLAKGNFSRRYLFALGKGAVLMLVPLVWVPLISFWFYSIFAQGSSDFANVGDLLYTGVVGSLVLFIPMYLLSGVVRHLQARSTGRSWIVEKKMRRFWPHIVGFRQFVCLSEKDKLNFESKSLKKASALHILPYSIAFGFVENWRNIVS